MGNTSGIIQDFTFQVFTFQVNKKSRDLLDYRDWIHIHLHFFTDNIIFFELNVRMQIPWWKAKVSVLQFLISMKTSKSIKRQKALFWLKSKSQIYFLQHCLQNSKSHTSVTPWNNLHMQEHSSLSGDELHYLQPSSWIFLSFYLQQTQQIIIF